MVVSGTKRCPDTTVSRRSHAPCDRGGFVLSNVCAGTGLLLRFTDSLGVNVVASNGLTLSAIVSRRTRGKVGVCFGNLEQCIRAAVTGYWEERKNDV